MSLEDLTEFESRLIRWISSSDFVGSMVNGRLTGIKVEEEEVYQALASLTTKVPEKSPDFLRGWCNPGLLRIPNIIANHD